MTFESVMDPALEKGYLEAQDAVGSLTTEEAWTAGGEQRRYVCCPWRSD
jgi:hypothetical protein